MTGLGVLPVSRQLRTSLWLDGLVSAVHLLPLHPYSSDDGYAVTLLQLGDNSVDAALRLLCRVVRPVTRIVRADQHDSDFRSQALYFAVLQSPQDMRSRIATEAEIERTSRRIELLPYRLEVFIGRIRFVVVIRDRVTDQDDLHITVRTHAVDNSLVAFGPPGVREPMRGDDRGIGRGSRVRSLQCAQCQYQAPQ